MNSLRATCVGDDDANTCTHAHPLTPNTMQAELKGAASKVEIEHELGVAAKLLALPEDGGNGDVDVDEELLQLWESLQIH